MADYSDEFDTSLPADDAEGLVFHPDRNPLADVAVGDLVTVKTTDGELIGRGVATSNDGVTLGLLGDPHPDL